MKRILFFGGRMAGMATLRAALLKAHVDAFTKTDGTVVSAHETAVHAAMFKPEHKAVVAAASRGEIDLQHAAEKHALGHDMAPLGQHAAAAGKLLDSMGKGPVAAASRGELNMQHHAEKVALGKVKKPAGDITQHPHYHAGDHQWLKDGGASDAEIKDHFDRAPARKAKADARMTSRSDAIDSHQSAHAKQTGVAMNRQQAAQRVADGVKPGQHPRPRPLRKG